MDVMAPEGYVQTRNIKWFMLRYLHLSFFGKRNVVENTAGVDAQHGGRPRKKCVLFDRSAVKEGSCKHGEAQHGGGAVR